MRAFAFIKETAYKERSESMTEASNGPKVDITHKAKTIVSYLEENSCLPDNVPSCLRPKTLQADIEGVLAEIEKLTHESALIK